MLLVRYYFEGGREREMRHLLCKVGNRSSIEKVSNLRSSYVVNACEPPTAGFFFCVTLQYGKKKKMQKGLKIGLFHVCCLVLAPALLAYDDG